MNDDYRAVASLEATANILETLPPDDRLDAWQSLERPLQAHVLPYLNGEARRSLVERVEASVLVGLGSELYAEELADIHADIPDDVLDMIFDGMDAERRALFDAVSAYAPDQVARYILHDYVALPDTATVRTARRALARGSREFCRRIYITDRKHKFIGGIHPLDIFSQSETTRLSAMIDASTLSLAGDTPVSVAIALLEDEGTSEIPIVDHDRNLLGVFCTATGLLAQRDIYEATILSTAGIDEEEDLYAPVKEVARSRGIWLGINLATAALASLFIGIFEDAIESIVALAVLMPIVASMGGITGSQTLATVIRRQALNQITAENAAIILRRETTIGFLNGTAWSIAAGLAAYLWFGNPVIALALGTGLLVNITVAAWFGMTIPLALRKIGIDPAVSGAGILTTATDIIGFVSFLGMATILISVSA